MSAIRRALVAAALFCTLAFALLVAPAVAEAVPPWSDLPTSTLDTYGLTQDDIGAMSNGYPDGAWHPTEDVTRGQFVRLALGYFRILPAFSPFVQQHFSDVPQDSIYYEWVEAAFEVGLVSGYQTPSSTERTFFGLHDPITREQAITILARFLSKMDPAGFDYSTYTAERCGELLAPFSDKDQVTHRQEVAMAIDTGVLRGSGTALAPKAYVTRIQAAALIVRTQSLLPLPEPPPPPPDTIFSTPLSWVIADAYAAGIQVDAGMLGSAAPWMPRTLTLRARLEARQDLASYQEIAETLMSLAEQYQDRMKYEQIRVLIAIPGGKVVYERTFEMNTSSGTTASTLQSAAAPRCRKPFAGWTVVKEIQMGTHLDVIYRSSDAGSGLFYVAIRGNTEIDFYGITETGGFTAAQLIQVAKALVPFQ